MPAQLLPLIVAKYLHKSHPSTLDAFLSAASLPREVIDAAGIPDLRDVVEQYESYLLAQQLQSVTLPEKDEEGSLQELVARPVNPRAKETLLKTTKETFAEIGTGGFLSVRWEKVAKREFNTQSAEYDNACPGRLVLSATDKSVKTVDILTGEVDQLLEPHKAAVLCTAIHPTRRRYLLTSSMDSTAILTDLITQRTLQIFPHGKFVVRCAFSPDAGRWVGTASYDRTIRLWEDLKWVTASAMVEADEDGDDPELAGEPTLRYTLRHTITLDQNPETLVFTPDGRYLMYTTRASCLLYYIRLPPSSNSVDDEQPTLEVFTKSFNPHPLDSHISFSVLNIVPDPSGRLLACQTGDHAGGTGERVLLYDISPPPADNLASAPLPMPLDRTEDGSTTLALRTRSAPQGGEENPRLSVIWTGEEGDPYVLPRLAWLPDSSGIITTTTAGELVLHSLQGKTVTKLKVHGVPVDGVGAGGAGTSAVVRDLCVVGEKDDVDSWRVVSVGYDATVRIS
ncbi:hypothetical protein QFC22_002559 [Naganishia vaughanmartiniae]|uniref:Uncharacterized protein n=1 Tax=Naganishia vaughanmartiniae TaxID=1424756 RepID=A0ACC2XB52_9TREE|nr:hypothetical protein QFC22_002559 [Naganishia vaughanmartiniae]